MHLKMLENFSEQSSLKKRATQGSWHLKAEAEDAKALV